MSFTERVIRLRGEAGFLEDTKEQTHIDGIALAAEHIELGTEVEEKTISWPRSSSLFKSCMRMHVLGDALNRKVKDYLSMKDRMMFFIGNSIHHQLQNTPTILGARRIGWWKCLACRKVIYFGGPPKSKCPKCGAYPEAISYHEHYIRGVGDPENPREFYYLTGHTDMFLPKKQSNLLRVTEFKTLGSEDFDKLSHPLIEHEWQLNLYMWGCSQDERIPLPVDSKVGYILYVCKRHRVKDLPFKMFKIHRNDELLARAREKLDLFRIGRKKYPKNLPPPDDRCLRGGMQSYMTKSCVVRDECLKLYGEE
jgi:hypothetical protein